MNPSPPHSAVANGGAETPPTRAPWFTTTHWSVVLVARRRAEPGAAEALEELCRTYWYPLYAFVRHQGTSPHDAEDLVQGFFARLFEKDYLQDVDPLKGRFRSFLLAALKHFLLDEAKWRRAEKRGGKHRLVSLDDLGARERFEQEAALGLTPEQVFDRNWALAVMDQALARLRAELRTGSKPSKNERLLVFLSSPPGEQDYAAFGAQLGIPPGAVAARVHRLRRCYRELVREQIAHTVLNPEELQQEMQYLFSILSR